MTHKLACNRTQALVIRNPMSDNLRTKIPTEMSGRGDLEIRKMNEVSARHVKFSPVNKTRIFCVAIQRIKYKDTTYNMVQASRFEPIYDSGVSQAMRYRRLSRLA
jgi:hypothetical protein